MVGEKENDWDNYLDPVLFGIRTSVQESTKFTPFFLMHGREARFPFEAERTSTVVVNTIMLEDVEKRIGCINKLKDAIFPVVKANIDNSQKKQKQQYQKRKGIVKTNIKVNDLVLRLNMLKRTKKGHKMEDTWKGPYKVRYISDKGSCVLYCTKTGKEIKQKVNISQLKLYNQPSDTKTMRQRDEEEVKESSISTISSSANSSMPACRSSSSMLAIRSCSESAESALNCTIPQPSSSPVIVLNSSDTKPSITPITLEKQLFDDSLLRFWRTGCLFHAWDSREDDQTEVCSVARIR